MAKKKHKKKELYNAVRTGPVTADIVREAIDQENSQKALDLAKSFQKDNPGAMGELLLAQAYRLRIRKLQQANLLQDAKNLIEVARSKCPNYIELFDLVQKETYHYPLTPDEVSQIALALHSGSDGEESLSHLSHVLKVGLSNPAYLLSSGLPSDAPLRHEALIVKNALDAVTKTGVAPGIDESLKKLTAVPRSSILADWCFFIRALDSYQRKEDTRALEFLKRIREDSILIPARSILKGKVEQNRPPQGFSSRSTREVWKSLAPVSLMESLQEIYRVVRSKNRKAIREKVKIFLQSGSIATPFMALEIVRSILRNMAESEIIDKEADLIMIAFLNRFWGEKGEFYFKLYVVKILTDFYGISDTDKFFVDTLSSNKNIISPQEQAAIYSYIAKAFAQEENNDNRFFFWQRRKKVDHSNSIHYYREACRLNPLPEYYKSLVDLMEEEGRYNKDIEEILGKWKQKYPNDSTPLIYLFQYAEKRKALQKAITYLEQAEKIDPSNPKVRNTRERLVWRMAQKHLQQKKPHLVEKDLKQIQMDEKSTRIKHLFKGIQRLVTLMRKEPDPGPGDVHPVFSSTLLHHFNAHLQLKMGEFLEKNIPLDHLDTGPKLEAYYNLRDALFQLGDIPMLPRSWFEQFPHWIMKAEPISEDLLLRISQTILKKGVPDVVFASTARGLHFNDSRLHEFLYYRALALMQIEKESSASSCLLAVIALCRAHGDYELAQRATENWRALNRNSLSVFVNGKPDQAEPELLYEYEVREIIEREKLRKDLRIDPSKRQKKKQPSPSKMKMNSLHELEQSLFAELFMDDEDLYLDNENPDKW